MSHPDATINGCSLEDCHTNLFALTDLVGIKWRKYVGGEGSLVGSEPRDDYVLSSFTRCIRADILCVWRRAQKNSEHLACRKELWIFWYGEEPPSLSTLVSSHLQVDHTGEGSWEADGLNYESRTLLFKALHNLIERCLLQQGFVRVGKWFVQPFDLRHANDKGAHLSIRFSFFLHGESTVCATIDVRQHPPLWRLQSYHLSHAANNTQNGQLPVLLAPYGLSGTVSGLAYKDSDPVSQQVINEWQEFYVLSPEPPIPPSAGAAANQRCAKVVDVTVGGARMRYPTAFVMVTAETQQELLRQNHGSLPPTSPPAPSLPTRGPAASPPMSPKNPAPPPPPEPTIRLMAKAAYMDSTHQPLLDNDSSLGLTSRIIDRVWLDSAATSGASSGDRHSSAAPSPAPPPSVNNNNGREGASPSDEQYAATICQWEFGEPTQKNPCACNKHKSHKRGGGSSSQSKMASNLAGKSRGDKGDKRMSFHRRHTLQDNMLQHEVEMLMQQPLTKAMLKPLLPSSQQHMTPVTTSSNTPAAPSITSTGPGTTTTTTTVTTSSASASTSEQQNANNISATMLDSPHSAAPSPLVASQLPTSGVTQNGDHATMPTLSPHPPPLSQPTTQAANTPKDPQQQPQPQVKTEPGEEAVNEQQQQQPTQLKPKLPFRTSTTPAEVSIKCESLNAWLLSQQQHKPIKRPYLPTKEYDDDDDEKTSMKELYNFNTLNAWLEHPVKKQKYEESQENQSSRSSSQQRPSSRGYRGENSPRAGHPPSNNGVDPFEFSEESSASNLFKGSCREENGMDDDDDDDVPASPTGNMDGGRDPGTGPGANFRLGLSEQELRPTMDDLTRYNIFDSSDSESNGPGGMAGPGGNASDAEGKEPFSIRSPSKFNDKMSPMKTNLSSIPAGAVISGPGLNELQVMYPTPPSMETNHNAGSPCKDITELPGGIMGGPEPDATLLPPIKCDVPYRPRGLEEQGVSDWSFVYKPGQHVEFVTSNKYEAVDLPSFPLLHQVYRPSQLRSHHPHHQLHHHLHHHPHHPHHPIPAVVTGPPPPAISAPQPHQQAQPHTLSANQHYPNVPSVENVNSVGRPGAGASSPYPSGGLSQQRTPRTPLSYGELQSPASNASSYMNKNINSVGAPSGNAEVHSLIVNIFLSDSMVNLFKDQNFDSCPICVCNTNIKGADVGLYLTDRTAEAQYACACGFSAVMNRKYGAAGSGLFYEDEVDITGLRDERLEQRKPSLLAIKDSTGPEAEKQLANLERVPPDVMLQLQCQFSSIFPSLTVAASIPSVVAMLDSNGSAVASPSPAVAAASWGISMLEKQDSCEACWQALEMGRQAVDHGLSAKLDDPVQKKSCMHHWPLQRSAPIPSNSQDVVRLLKSLQPLLQEALQKKQIARKWDHVYTITGPLSWKDFHLLAGRGADETSEPQPIPALLAGTDKDWLKMAPQALRFWDKLSMEPYGQPQDVAYIVVAPDNSFVLNHVRTFVSELSRQYEQCRLGKHRPLTTKIRDSTLRVGQSAAKNLRNEPVHDWFKALGGSPTAARLKLYAQFCQGHLAPFIVRALTEDAALLRTVFAEPVGGKASGRGSSHFPSEPSPAPPPTPEGGTSGGEADKENERNSSGPSTDDWSGGGTSSSAHLHAADLEAAEAELPAVVLYLIDPFSGTGLEAETDRLAMLGLLRCYQSVLDHVREQMSRHHQQQQPNIQLQLVPLHKLVSVSHDDAGGSGGGGALRSLAMAVYSQCRRVLTHTVVGKSMTGFGPVAAATSLLSKPAENMCNELQLYTPPYVVAPVPESKISAIGEALSQERSRVLLCGYCLSEDQRWLLAVCTDSKGEMMETCTINIEIPNRNLRKKASARRIGLGKLWDFILALVSKVVQPWRLVIGRFGRIGHGELKGWSGLLSSKHLAACNRQLRDTCSQCNMMGKWECPLLLSACLISMETHSTIHVMPASVKTEEEKTSSKIQMDTPRDASCTHILVVPTSAHAQASMNGGGGLGLGGAEDEDGLGAGGDDDVAADFLTGMMAGVTGDGMDDIDMMTGDISDISDLLGGFIGDTSDPMSSNVDHNPMHNQNSGVGGAAGGGNAMYPRQTGAGNLHGGTDPQDEMPNLQQQPLAMGFYTSTAKTGPLPKWFWAACPHRENVTPTCLKAALHVNSHAPMDLGIQSPKPKTNHPLESGFTCDVLRYVLETYNALSWLNMDPATNDRRSCLPIHFVVLMQLYHAINAFV